MPYKDPAKRREMNQRRRGVPSPFTYNGCSHVALMYLKMRGKPTPYAELVELNPTMFKAGLEGKVMGSLIKKGFVVDRGNLYFQITPLGIETLYRYATRPKPKPIEDDVD